MSAVEPARDNAPGFSLDAWKQGEAEADRSAVSALVEKPRDAEDVERAAADYLDLLRGRKEAFDVPFLAAARVPALQGGSARCVDDCLAREEELTVAAEESEECGDILKAMLTREALSVLNLEQQRYDFGVMEAHAAVTYHHWLREAVTDTGELLSPLDRLDSNCWLIQQYEMLTEQTMRSCLPVESKREIVHLLVDAADNIYAGNQRELKGFLLHQAKEIRDLVSQLQESAKRGHPVSKFFGLGEPDPRTAEDFPLLAKM